MSIAGAAGVETRRSSTEARGRQAAQRRHRSPLPTCHEKPPPEPHGGRVPRLPELGRLDLPPSSRHAVDRRSIATRRGPAVGGPGESRSRRGPAVGGSDEPRHRRGKAVGGRDRPRRRNRGPSVHGRVQLGSRRSGGERHGRVTVQECVA